MKMRKARFDIPCLELEWQATEIPQPVMLWGAISRAKMPPGVTTCFYTNRYRFNVLVKDTTKLVKSQPGACVELAIPQNGRWDLAQAIYWTYQRRHASWIWGMAGIPILVDLTPDRVKLTLEGVPKGWRAYAMRAYPGSHVANFERRRKAAIRHAGTDDILMLVYGGGHKAHVWAHQYDYEWVDEFLRSERILASKRQ